MSLVAKPPPPAELAGLESEILAHPALSHPFLLRFSRGELGLSQLQAFGLQHYQLVRLFTTHMANLVARRPEWGPGLRGVFADEFGQHTIFRSHVHLYREFLKALGLAEPDWGKVSWLPETRAFIEGHLELTREGDLLKALGAVGPGHELSIPAMFRRIVEGLRRNRPHLPSAPGLTERDIEYFSEHIEQDAHHRDAFNAIILRHAEEPQAFARVREGALFSLELRREFWDGLDRLLFP